MWPSSSARVGLTSTSDFELLVIDASVLVEVVIDGRVMRAAQILYLEAERLTLITAGHGLIEAANAVRKLVFRRRLTAVMGSERSRSSASSTLPLIRRRSACAASGRCATA